MPCNKTVNGTTHAGNLSRSREDEVGNSGHYIMRNSVTYTSHILAQGQ